MSTDERMKLATPAQKSIYKKLAEEGGGTWATYMMMDIEDAYAALRAPEAADAGAVALPAIAPEPCACCGGKMELNGASYSCDRQSTEHYHVDDLCESPTAAGIAAPPSREKIDAAGMVLAEAYRKAAAPPAASADAVREALDRAAKVAETLARKPDWSETNRKAATIIAMRIRALTAPVAGADAGMATRADLAQVLTDIYNEIGCAYDNEEALKAIAALKVGENGWYRHVKRRTTYRTICQEFSTETMSEGPFGTIRCAKLNERATVQGRIAFGDLVMFYRAEEDGTLWARTSAEFLDGRFEKISRE